MCVPVSVSDNTTSRKGTHSKRSSAGPIRQGTKSGICNVPDIDKPKGQEMIRKSSGKTRKLTGSGTMDFKL